MDFIRVMLCPEVIFKILTTNPEWVLATVLEQGFIGPLLHSALKFKELDLGELQVISGEGTGWSRGKRASGEEESIALY